MADDWGDEPEAVVGDAGAVPVADLPEILLFGKWSCDEVNVSDMSLQVLLSNFFLLFYFFYWRTTLLALIIWGCSGSTLNQLD